ncbi:MAG: hypothetical protein BMS9Abin05_0609 [Rhodothermia bacterium]|nr:MAG: hypothetical protein BMS9Abin05_0609 [Rhodothermia bacterium]
MNNTFWDQYERFRDVLSNEDWDESEVRQMLADFDELLYLGKEIAPIRFPGGGSHEEVRTDIIHQVHRRANSQSLLTAWEALRTQSVAELEMIIQAVDRQQLEVESRLRMLTNAEILLHSPHELERNILSNQRGAITSMIEYRLRRHLYTGPVPEWAHLDPETKKRLTKATRRKVTDEQMEETVFKVHEYLKDGLRAKPATGKAIEWLHEEYGVEVLDPKTIRRWAKDLGNEWWGHKRA